MPIPGLNDDGYLPPGRYPTTLGEIEAVFVRAPRYAESSTRPEVWKGFRAYHLAWSEPERLLALDGRLLLGYWIGGSFTTAALNPTDLDCSPILDEARLVASRGREGSGLVKKLTGQRDAIKATFHVEVFPFRWLPVRSSLFPRACTDAERHSLAVRGGVDTWWQRVAPPGPKGPPALPGHRPERGYLEVMR
jgi:hypothetical protein